MPNRRLLWFALFAASLFLPALAAQKPCLTADRASKLLNKNVCVSAHI